MTTSNAIISWLKTFDLEEYWKLKQIDTDLMHGNADYALIKAPVRNVKSYLSGKRLITEHFTLEARLPGCSNDDCTDNSDFGTALEEWIEEQNSSGSLPVLEGAEVQKVSVTTPFCIGKTAADEVIYQMSVSIVYIKEISKGNSMIS